MQEKRAGLVAEAMYLRTRWAMEVKIISGPGFYLGHLACSNTMKLNRERQMDNHKEKRMVQKNLFKHMHFALFIS